MSLPPVPNGALLHSTGGVLPEKKRVDVNKKDRRHRTPLSLTAESGKVDAIRALLESEQVDVNTKDMELRTPLIIATEEGNLGAVRALLESSQVDVNTKDIWGRNPLWIAARKGYTEIVKALLGRKDINPNFQFRDRDMTLQGTPLGIACYHGNISAVQELIADERVDINARDPAGLTPVHLSAANSRRDILRLLLTRPSIDALTPCRSGNTPLHTAAEIGDLDIFMQLLCFPGITNPDIPAADSWTPLGLAIRHARVGIIRALVKDGRVDINGISGAGHTPLLLAAKLSLFKVVKELLQVEGVDVYKQEAEGEMSFAEFVEKGNSQRMKKLLREKAESGRH
ncbi:unnamed protein product [Tuber aestivum]|uniref:Uncharacterized protein n=1 Tax=Tuber aestivum TaxID=59557 RepID=A0A292PL93_9PEZI|nr:unnamed protein product [Tuber aestivum]